MSLNCSSSANLRTDWINATKIFSTSKEGKLILQLLLMDSWLIGIGNNDQVYHFMEPTEIISSFYIVIFIPCQSPYLQCFLICIIIQMCYFVSAYPVGCMFFCVYSLKWVLPHCGVRFLGMLEVEIFFLSGASFLQILTVAALLQILHIENCHWSQWEFKST